MPPIKRHVIQSQFGARYTGMFVARFYGPRLKNEWGWYEASVLVNDNKEALTHFREWVTDTKAYINEQLQI